MTVLSDKIATLILASGDIESQVLEVCALLNTPEPIAPTIETRYKLKPLLIPHLIEEGIFSVEKLQAIATHPICSDFLKSLFREHYSGATEISPTIEQLLAAGRTFAILTEAEVAAVRNRLDARKIAEIDRNKPISDRRYEEWNEEIPQPSVSWAAANLGRQIEGDEVLQILGELYGY